MRNRASIDWQIETERERPWETDARPELRLAALFVLMLLPLAAVGVRFVWVQTTLTSSYSADFERTLTRTEPIPSQDGRILAANGEVLAEDVLQVGLSAHYRWIEDPPNPLWLRQQALAHLERSERRDKQRVQSEMERLVAERNRMWSDLSRLTGIDSATLFSARRDVQRRVERIRERAEERRWERQIASASESAPASQPESLWLSLWQSLVSTLTTPPRREVEEPLVVEEELAYHVLLPQLDPELATQIESRPAKFPGVRIAESTRRVYPHSSIAPHIIGLRRLIDAEELAGRRQRYPEGDPLDYREGDRVGIAGLEQQYDPLLRGVRGERTLLLNRHGEILRSEVTRARRPGRDITLSLDLAFQQSAERILDQVLEAPTTDPVTGEALPVPPGGSLIALDVRTGAILACATAPRFDMQLLVEPDPERWRDVSSDPRTPLFDRATKMTIPPGSVFKTISAVALLESGLDPEHPFHCQGFLERPDRLRCYIFRRFQTGHNDVTLVDALARSCNVYFFSHAKQLGPEPLHDWAARFGIGRKTGVDLPGESAGHLPEPRHDSRRIGDTLQLSIGQADLTVTPLQIARMMAAIANGGVLVTPHFLETTGSAVLKNGSAAEEIPAAAAERIPELSERTLSWVRMGLQQVVGSPGGTGYKTVRLDRAAIAGKTGTAEPGGGKPDHAWFAGYVPAERPRIAFVVVLEHAGSGGHAAGPVARKFVEAMLDHGLLGQQGSLPAQASR